MEAVRNNRNEADYDLQAQWTEVLPCEVPIQRRNHPQMHSRSGCENGAFVESTIRAELAKGNWGILERKPAPTLKEFLTKDFLAFTRTRFVGKAKTCDYEYGADRLSTSDLAGLRITKISGKHATQFAFRNSTLAASSINCGLRTLRRALNLAFEWGKLDKPLRVPLAKGERQRDRVLTDAEITLYLDNCRELWKDAATLIPGTGMRSGEVYGLRWEFVLLNGSRRPDPSF